MKRRYLVKCFMCGYEKPLYEVADKKPPYRCKECFAAVAMNEADGEL